MKRKKLMSILLVSALAAGMVSGCGNDKKEEPAENPENRKPYEGVELSMLVDNATGKEGYEAVDSGRQAFSYGIRQRADRKEVPGAEKAVSGVHDGGYFRGRV